MCGRSEKVVEIKRHQLVEQQRPLFNKDLSSFGKESLLTSL